MKKQGVFICFIGIDGSGKTTLVERINETLREKCIDSQYIYGRVVPIVSGFLMWMGRKFLLKRKKEDLFCRYEEYTTQKRKLFENNVFSKVFMYSILFDQIIQANIKIRPYLSSKKIIVCDRYIFDTIVTDISANLNYSEKKATGLLNELFRIVPKPDKVFLLDVPEEVAYSRKDDIPHIDYLRERRKLYLNVGKTFGVITLDGTKDLEELTKDVYIDIQSMLKDV